MINGEGTRENPSDIASPDPFEEFKPWLGQKLDGDGDVSPDLSDYSSCGESEFEKYCSANSVMGTASLCSSVGHCNEFLDSDFGSSRSLGFGEERVVESFGFRKRLDRNSGDKSFDCSSNGKNELFKEKGDAQNGVSAGDGMVSMRIGTDSWLKSLPSCEENSSSYGAICSQNSDENLTILKVGNGSESPRSSDKDTSLYRGICDKNNDRDLALARCNGESRSLPSYAENNSSHDTINAEYNEENLIKFGGGNRSLFFPGSNEVSSSHIDVSEDIFTEQMHGNLGLFHGLTLESGVPFDGREIERLSGAEEKASSTYEHSDDDGSMFGCGTDDEHSVGLYDRHLQYHQEATSENKNPLVINSTVAFGLDDWDEFMQEREENSFSSVLLDRLHGQPHLETTENLLNPSSMAPIGSSNLYGSEQELDVTDNCKASSQVGGTGESTEYLKSSSLRNIFAAEKDPLMQKATIDIGLNIMENVADREVQCTNSGKVIDLDESKVSKSVLVVKSEHLNPPNITVGQTCSIGTKAPKGKEAGGLEDHNPNTLPSVIKNDHDICLKKITKDSPASLHLDDGHLASIEVENLQSSEFYDEIVHEMEEILLDSGESPRVMSTKGNRASLSQLCQPYRDGSSTASTSGTDDAYPLTQHPLKIDGVEVVGAKQKKGDVSLGERLVGVKEYTVYSLRVWSGKDEWVVERRYRDFFTLYRQLKTLFADQGWSLPSPWSYVERESRKIFGNASPDVITERSALIQECLRSILHSGISSSTPSSLIWFLSPQNDCSGSSTPKAPMTRSTSTFTGGALTEAVSTLGKTISLLVEIRTRKSTKQLLEAQHYSCAGCHKHFDDGKTFMRDFVHTFGWGKPRLCEYTNQLFCALCHTNETAVLPARVLHLWDFTQYPVSQLAKSYLESIYNQPMLCVSAVNPFLFSKVPTLLYVMGIRKKIGAMLPYVRCPFRRSIHRGMGSRRHLLESNDFFALRDLVDLSKGAFAALPVMIETASKNILKHITEQCLVCCDVGVPCSARQACEDPSAFIFPFQESEVQRCGSCESVFHKPCFGKLTSCPCGTPFKVDKDVGNADNVKCRVSNGADGILDLSARKPDSGSSMGFLSGLFSKTRQEKIWSPRKNNPVILMGSLPSTSL